CMAVFDDFFFSSRRRHTRSKRDWSSDVCSSDLDVGSGKTLVAAAAALFAIEAGYQVALMAPTELLAEQHKQNFLHWLRPLNIPVGWLAGSMKASEKKAVLAQLAAGTLPMVVGTHALFQEAVVYRQLGLLI